MLFFSQINIYCKLASEKIQMIFAELLITYTLSIHVKISTQCTYENFSLHRD